MTSKRIISLVPSITELLIDLGLEDRLAGRTKFCIEPVGRVEHIPIVGGTKNFHVERIRDQKPDLIIANKEENDRERTLLLAEDFHVHVTDIKSLSDAIEMIHEIGALTGADLQASLLANQIERAFSDLSKPDSLNRAAYLIWQNPLMVAGGDTFISSMMDAAGFLNVFADRKRYPEVTIQDVRDAHPDLLLLSSEPFPFKPKHIRLFQDTFPNTQPLLVDGTYFSWYGSRLKEAPPYFEGLKRGILSQQ